MKEENLICICHDQIPLDKDRRVYVHLSWCPQSYVYKEEMERFKKASWLKRLFMYDPRKHPYGY
jgi:hypothetical protein